MSKTREDEWCVMRPLDVPCIIPGDWNLHFWFSSPVNWERVTADSRDACVFGGRERHKKTFWSEKMAKTSSSGVRVGA